MKTKIEKDPANKKITFVGGFNASRQVVWKAWAESTLLDQRWASKPWRKSLDGL